MSVSKTKVCTSCKMKKSLEEFHKQKSSPDGFRYVCKVCRSIEKKWEWKDSIYREYYRKSNREYYRRKLREDEEFRKRHNKNAVKYHARRLKRDPAYRLKHNVNRTVRNALKKSDTTKRSSTWSMLSYSPQELREHLESQFDENMTWENYGDYWHIDHIYPQSKLKYDSLKHENFQKCWALENLRPLKAEENLSKRDTVIVEYDELVTISR